MKNLKKNASEFLGKEVKEAVITVPNYFCLLQKIQLKITACEAGLNIIRVIDSSTAAGLACIYEQNYEHTIIVIDLGGGILNVGLYVLEDGILDCISKNGNINLGGQDFDNRIIEYCEEEFRRKTGIDIKSNIEAKGKLINACENAKKILSSSTQTSIVVKNLCEGHDLNVEISRSKFEELCKDLFKMLIPCLENVLKDGNKKKNQIDDIILIGGSTRIPKIQSMIKEFFDGKEFNKYFSNSENNAFGAAIQAAILTNIEDESIEKLVNLDAYPFSLGVEAAGRVYEVLIPRNSSIPTKKTEIFTTYQDNQNFAKIEIYEGERPFTKDNNRLEILYLEDIPISPRNQLDIEITFDLDVNLNFQVTVIEKMSGKSIKTSIPSRKTNKNTENCLYKQNGSIIKKNIMTDNMNHMSNMNYMNNMNNPMVNNMNYMSNPIMNNMNYMNNPMMNNMNYMNNPMMNNMNYMNNPMMNNMNYMNNQMMNNMNMNVMSNDKNENEKIFSMKFKLIDKKKISSNINIQVTSKMTIKELIQKFIVKICNDDINIKYSLNGNTLNPNSEELLYLKGINEFTIIEANVID